MPDIYICEETIYDAPDYETMVGEPTLSFDEAIERCKKKIQEELDDAGETTSPVITQLHDGKWRIDDGTDDALTTYYVTKYSL